MGGENQADRFVMSPHEGSSPRGRGKREAVNDAVLDKRLIPAWAGKTCGCGVVGDPFEAHPRVGGEN